MPDEMPLILDIVDRLVRRGAAGLAESAYWYWSARGGSEVAERNMTFHVAKALSEAGYLLYFECPFPDGPTRHIDLLAVHLESRSSVMGESKRLHSSEKAAEIASDFSRMADFKLSDEFAKPPKVEQRVALLLATTWSSDIARWWTGAKHLTAPVGARAEGWSSLGKVLDTAGSSRWAGEVPLSWSSPDGKDVVHHALYFLALL